MVNKLLSKLIYQIGLNEKHAVVYEKLLEHGSMTPLVLARETEINRTSLYRYLEELRLKGLVELALGDKSSKYVARAEGLNQYLVKEEVRLSELKQTIPSLLQSLESRRGTQESEVIYYRGREGLKQMLWNVVASGKEYVGLGYENWNSSVGKSFAERLRVKNIESGAQSREILNKPDDGFEYTSLGEKYIKIYAHRQIDPQILEIKHDTYVYGDVFAYYYHYQGEYFGVEIHNKEIAGTEKQMFEILWGVAKAK